MLKKLLNINPTYPSNVRLIIPGSPEINYFIQSAPLPSASISNQAPLFMNTPANMSGNGITLNPFNVKLIVDENSLNYNYILRWFYRICNSSKHLIEEFEDISLHTLDSDKQFTEQVVFYGAYPESISSLDFTSADIAFGFQYYKFIQPARKTTSL